MVVARRYQVLMASLFVVATPLQMLVAQQLVRQEKIKDAILLESYFSKHPDFLDSYEVCRIDELWKKRLEPVCDFPSWDYGGANLYKTAFGTWKKYRRLKRILREHSIDSIYLADFQNQTYRFMAVLFSKQGYNVNFYEEGYSHYVPRVCFLHTEIIWKIKEQILDLLYYLPIYHVRFAHWRNNPNCPSIGLPIANRYSIVSGFHHENYDHPLLCQPMLSNKLEEYLSSSVDASSCRKRYLLLTDPMSEVLDLSFKHFYFDVIRNTVSKLDKNSILYVKFHPRDAVGDRKKTLTLLEQLGVSYKVLSSKINIPVEYFLLNLKFEEIFFFNTSTYFYNGYLFPKCRFTQLLPRLYELCAEHYAPKHNLEQMRLLIDKMNSMKQEVYEN